MRLLSAIIGLGLGIGLGLMAGWVVWPVEFRDVTPEFMAADQQIDYAIMVATSFNADGNIDLARARLNRLGDDAEISLLNAFITAKDDPETLVALQKLAAELGLHATNPLPTE